VSEEGAVAEQKKRNWQAMNTLLLDVLITDVDEMDTYFSKVQKSCYSVTQ